MQDSTARREALEQYGKDIQDYRMTIASKVGDAVAAFIHSMTDENYTLAHGTAKAAMRACLEQLESYAYQRGIASDPRD
jgi:hypothetical protein